MISPMGNRILAQSDLSDRVTSVRSTTLNG